MLEFTLAGNTAEGQGRHLFCSFDMNRVTSVMFAVNLAIYNIWTFSLLRTFKNCVLYLNFKFLEATVINTLFFWYCIWRCMFWYIFISPKRLSLETCLNTHLIRTIHVFRGKERDSIHGLDAWDWFELNGQSVITACLYSTNKWMLISCFRIPGYYGLCAGGHCQRHWREGHDWPATKWRQSWRPQTSNACRYLFIYF